LTEAGWSKEGDAWSKDGQALTIEIEGNEEFADLSLILAEQLLRQGIGATFSVAFDLPERMAAGEYGAALGRLRGSISADPYYALVPFQTESATPKAGLQPNLSHWRNDAFDAVVDELAVQPVDHFPALDPDVLIGLWQEAMATWLPELPSIPLLETSECAPWSTGQWTGWPTASDPYAGASFAQATFQQVLNQLRPVR
jgi:peptide/nickel transport system substrate-binding protein